MLVVGGGTDLPCLPPPRPPPPPQVFRLAQLNVEYLLYVQDCLQTTNAWLQADRGSLEKHLGAAQVWGWRGVGLEKYLGAAQVGEGLRHGPHCVSLNSTSPHRDLPLLAY